MRLLFAVLFALALGACSSIPYLQDRAAGLGVQYATLKYIGDDAEKAERVVAIVGGLQAAVDGDVRVSVARLEAEVRDRINWSKLDVADTLLVNELIRAVAAELVERVGDGEIAPDRRLAVSAVLGWVLEAAALSSA